MLKISDKLRNNQITDKEAQRLLLDLFDVMNMLPTDEEIIKHAEYSTDFLHRNGKDMSVPREYFYAGADMVRRHFRTKKYEVTS